MSFIAVVILCVGIGCAIGSIVAAKTANDRPELFIYGMDDDFNNARFQTAGTNYIRR